MAARVAISVTRNESNNEEPRMHTPLIKRALWTLSAAAAALFASTAYAALQNRDLDGNGVTDAFYDTDLDITWLRDANVNGAMHWGAAVSWADAFSFGTHSDWRLPTVDTSCGTAFNCTGGEWGHLWYVELGNTAPGPLSNTGRFQNLQDFVYWSGIQNALDPSLAWSFYTYSGQQQEGTGVDLNELYAVAVRDGDVPAIPEPGTYALMLAGLGALAAARRRQQR